MFLEGPLPWVGKSDFVNCDEQARSAQSIGDCTPKSSTSTGLTGSYWVSRWQKRGYCGRQAGATGTRAYAGKEASVAPLPHHPCIAPARHYTGSTGKGPHPIPSFQAAFMLPRYGLGGLLAPIKTPSHRHHHNKLPPAKAMIRPSSCCHIAPQSVQEYHNF